MDKDDVTKLISILELQALRETLEDKDQVALADTVLEVHWSANPALDTEFGREFRTQFSGKFVPANQLHKLQADLATLEYVRLEQDRAAQKLSEEVENLKAEIGRLQQQLSPLHRFDHREFWDLVRKSDWEDASFARDKAHACALISGLCYLHVPEWELADDARYKLVPSEAYQHIVQRRIFSGLRDSMRDWDLPEPFIVETRSAVLVGVRFRDVVIVGVRGTAELYDHFINAQIWGRSPKIDAMGFKLHAGFAATALEALPRLSKELKAFGDRPVYFTGHSLGGAIAAILTRLFTENDRNSEDELNAESLHCYTFGMPRYGNAAAVSSGPQPFHLFNSCDLIPTIPPRIFDYADVNVESSSDVVGAHKRSTLSNLLEATRSAYSHKSMWRHHKMELYTRDVRLLSDETVLALNRRRAR